MTRLLPLRVCNKSSSQTSLAAPPRVARALPLLLIAAAGMLFSASRAAAQTSTWINAAGGKWSTSANWLGGIPNAQDATADFSTLVLPANETVHLDSSRTVGNLIFGDAGSTYNWTLDNNGSSGNQLTLAVSSVSPTVTVDFGTADISAALAGSQGFTLSDNPNLVEVGGVPFNPSVANVAVPGTLDLNSATASSIAGPIVLQGGTLLLDLSNLATPTNQIGSSSALTLAGGGLTVNFKSGSSTSSQTFGGDTTISPGAATVAANANGNTSAGSFLSLGNINRNTGGTVNFILPATGNITTSFSNTTSTILGGWATVNGSDWAAINANNDIVTSPAAGNAYSNDVWAADTTVTMSSDFSSSTSGLTTNSLRFGATSPAGGFTVTLPSSLNTISSGGILVTPALGVNGATIAIQSAGSATLTSGATPGELVVNQFDTNGPLVFSAEITDNGATSTSIALTKTGPGAVVLGNNGYSGGTYLNQGVLAIDANGGLGSPATGGTWLTFTGNATLQFINPGSSLGVSINILNRAIVVDAGSTATFDNLYYPPAFSESGTGIINFSTGTAITGAGGLAFVSSIGTVGNYFTLKNTAADTYSGPTTIFGGQLHLYYATDAASNDNKLNPNNSLFLGGVLSLQPNGAAGTIPTIQTLASSTSLIADTSSLITTSAALAGSSFSFAGASNAGTLVRSSGSTLAFLLTDASPATDAINIGKALANKQLLAGWATYGVNGSVTGSTDWASTDANGNIVSFTGTYTNDAWSAANNTTVTVGDNFSTSSGALTTNSLRFNAAAGLTITLPTGANSIASGGILVTPNVGTYGNTIAGGSLTSGNGADLIINQFNPQTSSQGSLTISSAIVNPAAGGSIGLTLSGNPLGTTTTTTGLVILASTANSYSGPTAINAGITLQAKAVNVIPATSALVLSGNGIFEMENFSQTIGSLASISYGTLISGASGSNGNPGPTLTVGGNNTSTTFDGALTGGISLVKTGTGTLTLQSLPAYTDFTTNTIPGLSTYNGGTTINGGTISIATDASLGGGGALTINGTLSASATLQATGTFTLSSNRNVFLGSNTTGSGGTIDVTNGNTLSYGGVMANNGGTNSLTLVDSGTLLLSGANSYTGATNINGGTLEAGAINAIPSASVVTVASGAAFVLNGSNQSISSLVGAGSVTNNSTSVATLTVGTATTNAAVFSGTIYDTVNGSTGKLSLTKTGIGTLTLTGVNTYTGATTVVAGSLALRFSAAVSSNVISPNSALVLGGGELAVTDAPGSAATAQSFSGTSISSGGSTVAINLNGNSNATSALVLGAVTRTPGSTVLFGLPTVGNITTTASNTDGILGAWATTFTGDWAANSGVPNAAGGDNIVAYAAYTNDYTSAAAATPNGNFGWGAGNNTSMISTNATTTNAIASGSTTNSLKFVTTSAYTITLSGANTITSGGIVIAPPRSELTETLGGSGTLTVGTAANELLVTMASGSTLAINAAILDNGTGTTGLTLTANQSSCTLALTNAANSYGGSTIVNVGTLEISTDHDLGGSPATARAGDLILDDGVLQTSGTFAINGNRGIALGPISGTGSATLSMGGGALTYGGVIANDGTSVSSLVVTDGTLILTGTNTYSGGTTVFEGTLNIASDAALGAATASPNIALEDGGTLQLAASFSGALSSSRGITVVNEVGTIDTNGNGTATAPIAYSGTLSIGGEFNKAGAGVFEIDSLPTFAGGIAVSGGTLRLKYSSTPAVGPAIASVSGGATLELAGAASQLSNAVNVTNAGTLLVSSTTAAQTVGTVIGGTRAAPAGATVVNAGASLTAYQIVQNSLTIGSGATVTLAPSGSGSTSNPTGPNNINFSSTLTSLSIAGTTGAWTGTLDIGNNGLVIAYGTAANDPYATIDNMIETGFDAAHWDGTGITSSLGRAAANSHTPLNIGLEDFTPGKGNFSTTTFIVFEGQTVTTNAILVRLTYMDDIVLAGDLNAQDASSDALIFAANYGTGTTWTVGDLEHTGLVDSADALLFAANYTPPLPSLDGTTGGSALLGSADSLAGGTAAVPEPASFLLAALAALALSAVGVFNRRRKMLPIPVTRVIPVAPPSRR